MPVLQLIAFSVLLSAGQILFKRAALSDTGLIGVLLNGWMVLALVLYAGATILWVHILRTTPLSLAYPFAALGFVIVPVAAHFIFGETISWTYALGAAMIVAGIVVVAT